MPKRGKANKEKPKEIENPSRSPTPVVIGKGRKLLKAFGFWFGILATVFGLLATYYSLQSKIQIYTQEAVYPDNPFATPFVIENESLLPIYGVDYKFDIVHLKFSNGATVEGFITKVKNSHKFDLGTGESTTAFIVPPFRSKYYVVECRVDLIVKYQPKFLPWEEQKTFRFWVHRDGKGHYHWLYSQKNKELYPPHYIPE